MFHGHYLYNLSGVSWWIISIFWQTSSHELCLFIFFFWADHSELAGRIFCGTFHSDFSRIYWGQSYGDLCRCLTWIISVFCRMSHNQLSLCSACLIASYLGIMLDVWWWFIWVCCWMSHHELCWYFVVCLM